MGVEPFHAWTFPDGAVSALFYRREGGATIRFPGLGDFDLAADGGTIVSHPCAGVDDAVVEQLLRNQVQPLAENRRGRLMFHGGCVEMGGGAAAFLGRSGFGKSTLTAALARAGRRYLGDDALQVDDERSWPLVMPSFPHVRLWSDSVAGVMGVGGGAGGAKAKLAADAVLRHCPEARPLAAAFFLFQGGAGEVIARKLAPSAAVARWTAHAFTIEVDDPAFVRRHFERVATLAAAAPSFELDFPRRYDVLPEVMTTIERLCREPD